MPDILVILWLPAAIAFMAVTYVLTLGALARPIPSKDASIGGEEN